MDKKALSGVVTAVIMIALVVVAVSIVWVIVEKIIKGETEQAESCFGIFEKVSINNEYTCMNLVDEEFQFSINIGDIDVEKVLVSISGEEKSKSFEILSSGSSEIFLKEYGGENNYGNVIMLPGENAGLTYVVNTADTGGVGISEINSIKIAPVIEGNQCEVSDTLSVIDDCRSFV